MAQTTGATISAGIMERIAAAGVRDWLYGNVDAQPMPYTLSGGNWSEDSAHDVSGGLWSEVYPDVDTLGAAFVLELLEDHDTITAGYIRTYFGIGSDADEDEYNGTEDLAGAVNERIEDQERGTRGIMVSSLWPVELPSGMSQEVAQAILMRDAATVALVDVDGASYIGLTGCGMDLTPELITAYAVLGLVPPFTLAADIPGMCGLYRGERWPLIVAGASKSIEAMRLRAMRATDSLARLVESQHSDADTGRH